MEAVTQLALRVTAVHYSPSVKKREEPVSALGFRPSAFTRRLSTHWQSPLPAGWIYLHHEYLVVVYSSIAYTLDIASPWRTP
jgi:hypothetical protein